MFIAGVIWYILWAWFYDDDYCFGIEFTPYRVFFIELIPYSALPIAPEPIIEPLVAILGYELPRFMTCAI